MERNKIKSEERVFNSYFKVDEATIEHTKIDGGVVELSRMKLARPDAVAVLIYNKDTNRVTLVRQFRYPIAHREKTNILEIVAGKMDGDEFPSQTAEREVFEETGYRIPEDDLIFLTSVYSSPGYSTEMVHLFASIVDNSMKESGGGGLEAEFEGIETVDVDFKEFFEMIDDGRIRDSKTILAATMFLRISIQEVLDLGFSIKPEKR